MQYIQYMRYMRHAACNKSRPHAACRKSRPHACRKSRPRVSHVTPACSICYLPLTTGRHRDCPPLVHPHGWSRPPSMLASLEPIPLQGAMLLASPCGRCSLFGRLASLPRAPAHWLHDVATTPEASLLFPLRRPQLLAGAAAVNGRCEWPL